MPRGFSCKSECSLSGFCYLDHSHGNGRRACTCFQKPSSAVSLFLKDNKMLTR